MKSHAGRQPQGRCWCHFLLLPTLPSLLLIWPQEVAPALRTAPPTLASLGSPDGYLRRILPAVVSSSLALQHPAGEPIRPEKTKLAKQGGENEGKTTNGKSYAPIVEREVESAGRAPEDEGAGEEFPDLASGASLGSSLWLLSCLGGRHGNCLVSPNSTSATSISSWMKDGDLEIFGGGGCGGVVEGAGDGDGRCFGAGPGPPLLPPPSGF